MFNAKLDFPKYNATIKIDSNGVINIIDTKKHMTFDSLELFERSIICDGISYGKSKPSCTSGLGVLVTSKYGVVYRVLLYSFDIRYYGY